MAEGALARFDVAMGLLASRIEPLRRGTAALRAVAHDPRKGAVADHPAVATDLNA